MNKLKVVWCILNNELPEENFVLLKFLMEFLDEVLYGWFMSKRDKNQSLVKWRLLLQKLSLIPVHSIVSSLCAPSIPFQRYTGHCFRQLVRLLSPLKYFWNIHCNRWHAIFCNGNGPRSTNRSNICHKTTGTRIWLMTTQSTFPEIFLVLTVLLAG